MSNENKTLLKGTARWLCAVSLASSVIFVACGDDSSSAETFSMKKSFEMVLDKAKYSYDDEDSTLKQIMPVCKEGTLGHLVGPDDTDEWDTLAYKAYLGKNFATLKTGAESFSFSYDGTSFPKGFWVDPEYASQRIQKGMRFEKSGLLKSVIRYDGNCFMKDYYSVFRKGNPALENMDATLTSFYRKFLVDSNSVDEKTMIADMRANCDDLSLFDGLVHLNLVDFRESSGRINITYSKRSCDVSFQIRYAYEQKDCEAAFEDYKNDRESEKVFEFDDYSFDVTYGGDDDDFCIRYMVLDLQKDKGVKNAKSRSTREFTHDIVKLVVEGLK